MTSSLQNKMITHGANIGIQRIDGSKWLRGNTSMWMVGIHSCVPYQTFGKEKTHTYTAIRSKPRQCLPQGNCPMNKNNGYGLAQTPHAKKETEQHKQNSSTNQNNSVPAVAPRSSSLFASSLHPPQTRCPSASRCPSVLRREKGTQRLRRVFSPPSPTAVEMRASC